jgi:hypothetical protein
MHHFPDVMQSIQILSMGSSLLPPDRSFEVVIVCFRGQLLDYGSPSVFWQEDSVRVVGTASSDDFCPLQLGWEALDQVLQVFPQTCSHHDPFRINRLVLFAIGLASANRTKEAISRKQPHEFALGDRWIAIALTRIITIAMSTIYTIGHSTHPLERFIELLQGASIGLLADVRKYPGSRRLPHFNQEALGNSLSSIGIDYRWYPELGGRRPRIKDDKLPTPRPNNSAWRNDSFRNYADYMLTEDFETAIARLRRESDTIPAAIMCSEGLYWKCHRRLISDYLVSHKTNVQHIMPDGKLKPHELTPGAEFTASRLSYPSPPIQQQSRLF